MPTTPPCPNVTVLDAQYPIHLCPPPSHLPSALADIVLNVSIMPAHPCIFLGITPAPTAPYVRFPLNQQAPPAALAPSFSAVEFDVPLATCIRHHVIGGKRSVKTFSPGRHKNSDVTIRGIRSIPKTLRQTGHSSTEGATKIWCAEATLC